MAGMTIIRTKVDNKSWLVSLDGQIISEIECEAADALSSAFDPEQAIAVEVRAHAASHSQFAN